MNKIKNFDIAEYLDSEEMIQAYLAEVLKDGDKSELMRAVEQIVRARSRIGSAMDTGINHNEQICDDITPERLEYFQELAENTELVNLVRERKANGDFISVNIDDL